MSKGRWRPETRERYAIRRSWCMDDYDNLRALFADKVPWPDIADTLGRPEEICRRVAEMMGLGQEETVNRVAPPPPRETLEERDARYVQALMEHGGFCRVEFLNGKPVHVYPRAA